ncbi:MAG: ABC transporter ATP-binding protein [bacterium]
MARIPARLTHINKISPAGRTTIIRILKSLAPYLLRHKWPLAGGFLALVATNYLQVKTARIVGWATDDMKSGGAVARNFALYACLIVGLTLVLGIFRYLMRMWIVGASRNMEFELRNDFFTKLQLLTPAFYDKQRTGDLMSKATNDVDAVRDFLGPGILQFFNSVILLPLALWRMIMIDPLLTAACMSPMILLPLIVYFFGIRIHERFRKVQDHFSVMSAMVQENLTGIRIVKSFVQETPQKELFAGQNREFIRLNLGLARLYSAFFPLLKVLAGLSVALLLWVGGLMVVRQRITIGLLVEFSLIQVILFWPMIALGWAVNLLQRGSASMDRITEVLRLEPDILEAPPEGAGDVMRDTSIEMRNLDFRYTTDGPLVLRGISMRVPPGGRLGIVGPTGCGKSTFASLLAHLYEVPRGTLFIGGADINDITLTVLRARVSIVFQETFLFSDTIASNIAFGVDDADPEAMRRAASQAHIAAEIESFPHGYETMLGERGINLSGGQKQRTAIARALLRDPGILVLDDALSAVDTETETRIIESLDAALRGRTAIIISHRISAVMRCDEIIVIENGSIIERGTHGHLAGIGGLYASLYEKQLLTEAVEMET